jgi:hypothetical protein
MNSPDDHEPFAARLGGESRHLLGVGRVAAAAIWRPGETSASCAGATRSTSAAERRRAGGVDVHAKIMSTLSFG